MKDKIRKFIKRFGWFGFLRLLFSPLTVFLTTPYRFILSLWSCKVLADGKWNQYNRFNPHRAVNSLFYWTQAVNIDKYGMNGYSPTIADGKFHLAKWFQISLPSVYMYWRLGIITPIVGMFIWLLAHFIWLDTLSIGPLSAILLLVMLSSTFYANMFEMQNYNVIGWVFFPIGVYGLYTGNYEIAAIGWLLTTFGSFTAWFTGSVLTFTYSIGIFSFEPLVYLIPSIMKMILHFIPLIKSGSIFNQLEFIAKGIGIKKTKVKYKRKKSSIYIVSTLYYLILYLQFFALHIFMTSQIEILFITMLILFILNNTQIVRYADPGSLHIPILSIAVIMLINSYSITLFISFLILINPIALFLDFTDKKQNLDIVPERKPFLIHPLIVKMTSFFEMVNPKDSVYFSFENPNGNYASVFNGQRALLEVALHEAAQKEFHLLPDWYLVFQDNTTDNLPNFWGRDLTTLNQVTKDWSCQYIVYYSFDKREEIFSSLDYEIISEINWKMLNNEYNLELPENIKDVKWYLFKVSNV